MGYCRRGGVLSFTLCPLSSLSSEAQLHQIWEPVFEEWFASFPEWLRTYKDIPLDVELTVKQKIEVVNTVEARKCVSHIHRSNGHVLTRMLYQKIVNKFKNNMGSSKAN